MRRQTGTVGTEKKETGRKKEKRGRTSTRSLVDAFGAVEKDI